jgi:hypothetical protein
VPQNECTICQEVKGGEKGGGEAQGKSERNMVVERVFSTHTEKGEKK